MPDSFNLVGRQFGRLTVIEKAPSQKRHARYLCRCFCGKEVNVDASNLKSGCTQSCGCLHREISIITNTKHGGTKSRLHAIWKTMRQRCKNPNRKDFKRYGGRGIKVCEEWDVYDAFREWALSNGYDETAPQGECTIDRIDVDGDYCPDNCRWVSMKIQSINRRKRNKENQHGH